MFTQVTFDAHLQSHVAGRATDARAVEADLHDTVRSDADELDITTVGLDRRADEVHDPGDPLVQFRFRWN